MRTIDYAAAEKHQRSSMNQADDEMDDLLSRWHHWQKGEKASRGFAPKALVVGDFKASRQYDDANGQLEADLENRTMRQLDFQVRSMDDPWKIAIYVNARACMLGITVYTSPRLPRDRDELQAIVTAARAMLRARLISVGIIG